MNEQLYLVDFENVPGVDLSGISLESRVIVFTGVNQKSVPLELVSATQRLGDRLEWRRVDASGHNALDFFIACELGRVQAAANGTTCTVVSNDKGFDPLLRHLNAVGVPCQRIRVPIAARVAKAAPAPKPTPKSKPVAKAKPAPKPKPAPKEVPKVTLDPAHVTRVLEIFAKMEKKSRPQKHKKLEQAISSFFQKKISKDEIEAIIAKLVSDKKISDNGGAISYAF